MAMPLRAAFFAGAAFFFAIAANVVHRRGRGKDKKDAAAYRNRAEGRRRCQDSGAGNAFRAAAERSRLPRR